MYELWMCTVCFACRQYAAKIERPYEVRYDAYTQSIQILDHKEVIEDVARVLKADLTSLQNALAKIDNLVISWSNTGSVDKLVAS